MKTKMKNAAADVPPVSPVQRPDEKEMRHVRLNFSSSNLIQIVIVIASVWLLIKLWPVVLVLIVALMIVGTMSPAVTWLEERDLSRNLSMTIVFSILSLLIVMMVTLTIPSLIVQASELVAQEPVFRERISEYLSRSNLTAPLAVWLRKVEFVGLGTSAFDFSMRIVEMLAYGTSTIFLALYIMIDRDRLRGGLFSVVPRSHHIRLARVLMNLETIVGAYIRGQLITCVFIGLFAFVLLIACGVPNAFALAVFAGIADVLPYIGAILSIAPMVLASIGQGPVVVTIILLVMLVYEEFESRYLVPRIYGRALRLPASVVLFSLLAGGTLMGIMGALLALPVAAAIMMLVDELRVELPGTQKQMTDLEVIKEDERAEEEYVRRTVGSTVEQSAVIAALISDDRRKMTRARKNSKTVRRPGVKGSPKQ